MSYYLSADQAGELGILATASGVIATLVVLGLPTALIRAWQRTSNHRGVVLRGLLIPLTPAILLLAAAVLLPGRIASLMKLDRSGNVIHAVLLGIGVAYVQLGLSFFRADGRHKQYLGFGLARGLTSLVLLAALLWSGVTGVVSFLSSRWIPAFVAAAVAFVIMLRHTSSTSAVGRSGSSDENSGLTTSMLAFGLPLLPASLAMLALSSADMFMLRHLHPESAQTGYYYWANTACMMMIPLTAGFEMAWPRFIFRMRDSGGTLGDLGRASLTFLVIVVWSAALLGIAGPEIVRMLGGDEFAEASRVLPTLAGATAMYSLFLVAQTGPLLTGQTKFIAGMTILGVIINVGFNIRLIPIAGAMGAAFATLGTNMFMALSLLWLGRKVFPVNPFVVILVIAPLIAIGPLARTPGYARALILFGFTGICGLLLMLLRVGGRKNTTGSGEKSMDR
jgi:O-antigen/teichoic acid export membrane protein